MKLAPVVLVAVAWLMQAGAATNVTEGGWDLYRSSTLVTAGYQSEAACIAAASAMMPQILTCRTTTTIVVTADPVPPPNPPTNPQFSSALLTWTAPITNTDGSLLVDLSGYKVYWSASLANWVSSVSVPGAGTLTYRVTGLAAGTWYFTVTAVTPRGESTFATPVSLVVAGSPGGTITFTQAGSNGIVALTFLGTSDVTLTLPTGLAFDWVRQDTATGSLVTTTPSLGMTDNDGISSRTVTLHAPFSNLYVDVDGATLASITATVNGATKSFTHSGTAWSVSFP